MYDFHTVPTNKVQEELRKLGAENSALSAKVSKLELECQKPKSIEGVPNGFRIKRLVAHQTDTTSGPHPGVYYEAILERIPKPKRKVLVVPELDISELLDKPISAFIIRHIEEHPIRLYTQDNAYIGTVNRGRIEEREV